MNDGVDITIVVIIFLSIVASLGITGVIIWAIIKAVNHFF